MQDVVLIPEDDITSDADGETLAVMRGSPGSRPPRRPANLWRIWNMDKKSYWTRWRRRPKQRKADKTWAKAVRGRRSAAGLC